MFALALAFAPSSSWGAEYFPRDLSLGDEGGDVTNLQLALNLNSTTQIAEFGPGSPGQETNYFGELTAQAVVRYQKARGLTPNGIVSGRTKAALQADIEADSAVSAPAAAGSDSEDLAQRAREVGENAETKRISSVSGAPIVFTGLLSAAEAGKPTSLVGYNFRQGEEYGIFVASTSKLFAKAVATSSITLNFKAPRMKAGIYTLYVEGVNGRSAEFSFPLGDRGRPSISSVTPRTIKVGDTVTIKASRLGRNGVKVVTSMGTVEDVVVKGGKITFTSNFGADLPPFRSPSGATTTVPMTLRIETPRGSSDPELLYVQL